MAQQGIKIRFDIDDSPIKSALTQIDKESKKVQKSLREIDKLLELDPTNVNLLNQKQQLLARSIELTTNRLKALEKAQDDVTASHDKWSAIHEQLEQNTEAIRTMSDSMESAKARMSELSSLGLDDGGEYKELSEEVNNYEQQLNQLKETQKQLKEQQKSEANDDTYQNYSIQVEALRVNLNQLNQQQEQAAAQISQASQNAANNTDEEAEAMARATEEAEAQATAEEARVKALEEAEEAEKAAAEASKNYKNSINELKEAANKVKDDMSEIATAIGAVATATASAVVAGTTASVKTGMDFTSALSKVQAISGATGEELDALEQAAREAGATTTKTATEAANALSYMALAGWDTEQMLSGLMPILRASEAGEMDLATCSDLVTDSMSAAGVEVQELEHYLDILATTQSTSNATMQELLEAYIECGGTLDSYNISLEESSTILGILANRGIKGSEAGRDLNAMLINLIGVNRNAASAMNEMGVSAFDADGHFIGLSETLQLVKDKLEEYGDDAEKISQIEAKLGGKTQLNTLQALLNGMDEDFSKISAAVEDTDDALNNLAETMWDNLSGDIKILQSTLDETKDSIFDGLEEPFRSAVQNSIESFQELNANLGKEETAEKIKNIASSLGELYDAGAEFVADTAIPQIIDWLNWIAENSDVVIAGLEGIGAAWLAWKLGNLLTDLDKMKVKLVEAVAAKKAMAAASTENAAAQAAETLTLKDYTAALISSQTAMLGVISAIGALLVVGAKLLANHIDEAGEALLAKNALNEETQALYDQAKAIESTSAERENEIKKIDEQSDRAAELWEKIVGLVDEEGKATGSTQELQSAISEFNSVAGENIEVLNGQIQGYEDLKKSMDDIIEADRNQAKMEALEPAYQEAAYNIDKVKEEIAAAEAEYLQLADESKQAREKLENEYVSTWDKISDHGGYTVAKGYSDAVTDAEAQAAVRLSSLRQIAQEYQEVLDEYESLKYGDYEDTNTNTTTERVKSTAQLNAEEMAAKAKQANEELAKQQEEDAEKLEEKLTNLDNELATRKISEEEYWGRKEKLVNKFRNEDNAAWWEYFDEVKEHNEDEIKEQIEALEDRQELNDEYTEEMMYNEISELISGLDEESEVYQKYNKEILKWRKEAADEASEILSESIEKDIDNIEDELKTVEANYKSSMDSLLSEKDAYYNKLASLSDLTSTSRQQDENGNSAEVFSLTDPEEALKKLDEYESRLAQIEAKGASQNVLDWVNSLDATTGEKTIEVLSEMTEEKLKEYSESFDLYQDKLQTMTDNKYADKIEELNTNFVQEVDALLAKLPENANGTGYMTAEGFVNGLSSDSDLYDAVSNWTSSILTEIREGLGIHSPSKETEQIGEYAVQGFANALNDTEAANIASSFTDSFINELIAKEPEIQKALKEVFDFNIDLTLESLQPQIAEAISELSASVPDIPTIKTVQPAQTTTAEISAGSNETESLAGQISEVLSAVNSFITKQNEPQTVKILLELTGNLTADSETITAEIVKQINEITIQSGKGALIY